MKVHHDLHNLPAFRNAVITIGSYDGVHTGHQQILQRLTTLAKRVNGESVVITFHPHPRLVLFPKDDSLQLITTIDEKVALLERYGIDHVVIVPFTPAFGLQSADEYIERFLIEKFQPAYIVIGYDHRFGKNRQGDIHYLKWHAKQHGFSIVEISKKEIEAAKVSSTRIRQALETGQVAMAATLLGHFFTLSGKVENGQKIGRTIGFPTANVSISSPHKLIPPFGIYAVYVHHRTNRYEGMLYIGDRPTLPHLHNRTIEVNIFDFEQEIYGDELTLELIERIRDDQAFDSLTALQKQLQQDKIAAKKVFSEFDKSSPFRSEMPPVGLSAAVVILNYNGRQWLEQFLPQIVDNAALSEQIIVADNGSTDDSLRWLNEHFSQVQVIDLQHNYGFAGGYNKALQQVEAEVYVLLNSDVEVTPHWTTPILKIMAADESIGIAQPKIKAWHNRDLFEYAGAAGGYLDFLGYPFCRGRLFETLETDTGQYNNTTDIFWASGAALFIRSDLYHTLGGFDADYFAHWEEIDLCWRAKRAGYRVIAVPEATVFHVGGGTLAYQSPQKTYLNFRNNLYTLVKNTSNITLLWLIPLRLVLDGMAGGLFLTQGKFRHIWQIIRAHFSFYGALPRLLSKRKAEQRAIQRANIGASTVPSGLLRKSVLWHYFVLGKKRFQDYEVNKETN